jgi:16S rRNA pseudouridine516 synthase
VRVAKGNDLMINRKAVIFDLDGTIIDTSWIWRKVTVDLITSRGITCTDQLAEELENELCGLELHAACSILKEATGITDSIPVLVAEKKQRACELYENQLTFIPGFETFHQSVAACGLKSGIATNSDIGSLNQVKDKLKLERFFGDHIYSIADVNFCYKPDPAVYLHAAQKLGINPEDCIAIEDSKHGVTAAKKAGMFCIGINSGGFPDLIRHADIVINQYDEIDLNSLLHKKGL